MISQVFHWQRLCELSEHSQAYEIGENTQTRGLPWEVSGFAKPTDEAGFVVFSWPLKGCVLGATKNKVSSTLGRCEARGASASTAEAVMDGRVVHQKVTSAGLTTLGGEDKRSRL